MDVALASSTIESSVIWLSAKLSDFKFFKQGRVVSVSTALSVMNPKFWERSIWMIGRGKVICSNSFNVSSLMFAFLKLSILIF